MTHTSLNRRSSERGAIPLPLVLLIVGAVAFFVFTSMQKNAKDPNKTDPKDRTHQEQTHHQDPGTQENTRTQPGWEVEDGPTRSEGTQTPNTAASNAPTSTPTVTRQGEWEIETLPAESRETLKPHQPLSHVPVIPESTTTAPGWEVEDIPVGGFSDFPISNYGNTPVKVVSVQTKGAAGWKTVKLDSKDAQVGALRRAVLKIPKTSSSVRVTVKRQDTLRRNWGRDQVYEVTSALGEGLRIR